MEEGGRGCRLDGIHVCRELCSFPRTAQARRAVRQMRVLRRVCRRPLCLPYRSCLRIRRTPFRTYDGLVPIAGVFETARHFRILAHATTENTCPHNHLIDVRGFRPTRSMTLISPFRLADKPSWKAS